MISGLGANSACVPVSPNQEYQTGHPCSETKGLESGLDAKNHPSGASPELF